MRIEMRIDITYFTLDGKRFDHINIKQDELGEDILFPGNVINKLIELSKTNNLPKVKDNNYHILVNIMTNDTFYNRLILHKFHSDKNIEKIFR